MATISEAKWGIRAGGGAQTAPQKFALIVGIVYVALGIIGFFVTGFGNFVANTHTALLGLFHLNPFHNVVHLLLGVMALFAALALSPPATEGVNFIFAGILLVVAFLGFRGDLDDLLSVPAGWSPITVLHLVLAVVTLFFSNPLGLLKG
jgi:hypothetical protein